MEDHSVLLPFGDTGIYFGGNNWLVFYSSTIYPRGQQTFSVKDQILNISALQATANCSAIVVQNSHRQSVAVFQ